MKIEIRYAKLEDAARLVEIYCYYVEKTAITFNVRAAYDWCVETSIYVDHTLRK